MENSKSQAGPANVIAIGKRLKEAREKKSLAIDQIQKQTRIHSSVLIALEEGTAAEMLTEMYLRSFLKKYAQFLSLDAGEILKEYFPPQEKTAPSGLPVRENALPQNLDASPKFLYLTGILVAAVIVILLLLFLAGSISAHLKKPRAPRQKKSAAQVKSSSKESIPQSGPLNLVIKVKKSAIVKVKKDGMLLFERYMPKNMTEDITADNKIELEAGRAGALELKLNGKPVTLPSNKSSLSVEITRKGVKIK